MIEESGAPPTATEIDARVTTLNSSGLRLAEAQATARSAQATVAATAEALDDTTRRHLAIKESAVIRPLLGRIAPTECPRCAHHLDDVRGHREGEDHCFVCDAPLENAVEDEAELAEAEREFADATTARDEAQAELAQAGARVSELELEHARALAAVRELEDVAPAVAERARFEQEAAVAEALLARDERVQAQVHNAEELELRDRVLEAAQREAEERRTAAARDFRERLGTEIVALGQRFGVHNLESADPKLNAAMTVAIGGAQSNFSDLSPGEQLRLRIATLIGLLRIGEELGIGRFPGMLLIDSPNSEEMVEADAAEIIDEIASICDELPTLQIVLASARPGLIEGKVSPDRMIGGKDLGMVF